MPSVTKMKLPAVPSPSSSLLILSPLVESSACGFDYRLVMVRRNAKSSFKNATVFPGGNVDACDHVEELAADPAELHMNAFKRCALRETFEETGILITSPRIQFSRGERTKWRSNVHNEAAAFRTLLTTYKTAMNLQELIHYANWITPEVLPRRYDTNFFLAVVSSAETLPAKHDNSETLKIDHFTPTEAIEAHGRGEIVLFLPQLYMLHDLSLYKSYTELLNVARIRPVIKTQPKLQPKLGFVALPGDEIQGGRNGTRHRVSVTVKDGNLVPGQVTRLNLEGFLDMETAHVLERGNANSLKGKM